MGSWNATCAVSQLPIEEEDKVRLLFLMDAQPESDTSSGFCSVAGLWKLLSLPIAGKYDGYGHAVKIRESDLSVRLFMDFLRDNIVTRGEGENDCRDVPVNALLLTDIDVLQGMMHYGRVQIWSSGREPEDPADIDGLTPPRYLSGNIRRQVGSCLIREDVYQGLVKRAPEVESWQKKHTLESEIQRGHDWLDRARAQKTDPCVIMDRSDSFLYMGGVQNTSPGMYFYGEQIVNLSRQDATYDAELDALIKTVAETHMLNIHMSCLRKHWNPQSGAGSQDADFDSHILLGKLIQKIASKRAKRFAEEG